MKIGAVVGMRVENTVCNMVEIWLALRKMRKEHGCHKGYVAICHNIIISQEHASGQSGLEEQMSSVSPSIRYNEGVMTGG